MIVDLYGFQIYFEGVRGNGWAGDIALDDILLTPGTCGKCITKFNQMGGVMVSVFASSAVDSRVRAPVGSN